MTISDEGTIREYYELRTQLDKFADDIQAVISHPDYSLAFMSPGRLVHIKHKDKDFGWGVVVNYKQRKPPKNSTEEIPRDKRYVVDVLLNIAEGPSVATKTFEELPSGVRPVKEGDNSRMEVVPVLTECIRAISHVRMKLPKDLNPKEAKNGVKKSLAEIHKRFPDGIATLDPIEDMNIKDESFKKLLRVRTYIFFCIYFVLRALLTIITESRGPRVSFAFQPTAQLTPPTRTLRAIFREGGVGNED
jgi:ATP-dependent RNA helicase DOB1